MSEEKIRCYRDQTVMVPVEGHPGWIRCPTCQFVTMLVGYDEDEVAKMVQDWFDGESEENGDEGTDDGALYPNGHRAPVRRPGSGGGGGSGRRRKRETVMRRRQWPGTLA